jgi:hypothetical protein
VSPTNRKKKKKKKNRRKKVGTVWMWRGEAMNRQLMG